MSVSVASSQNISDQEHEERLLVVTLQPKFFEACLGCATAGILLFMCIYGLNLHLETPKDHRRGRKLYVMISFLLLILHCFGELPVAYKTFQLLYKPDNWMQTYSLIDEINSTWWCMASDWANTVLVWVGDGLLVYRCHIVWTGRSMVAIFPATVYVAAVGVSIFGMVAYSSGHESRNADAAYLFLSVGVNCIVTFLVSLRLLYMRKKQAAVMSPIDSRAYIGVVSILVESSLPLAMAGVVLAATSTAPGANSRSKSYASLHNIFLVLWNNLSALAPALIIFRVAAGRSWDHHDHSRNMSHLSTLAFQPQNSLSSEDASEPERPPRERDLEKNEVAGVLVIGDQNLG